MHVAFRVDATEAMGTGHLVRCLTLANALATRGVRCSFLCLAECLGTLEDRIGAAGHALRLLRVSPVSNERGPPHAAWLPHAWQHDAAACEDALASVGRPDWLVVDHYALDASWESAMSGHARSLLVVDDLADRAHVGRMLLDQNPLPGFEARYAGLIAADCRTLVGPRFALLRPEFTQLRAGALARRPPGRPQRILVMMGGADRLDVTGAVVDTLADLPYCGAVDVVAGPLYPRLDALRARVGRLRSASLLIAPSALGDTMAQADLAIGAPSVTSYERCTLGLPTVAIASAANQEPLGEELHRLGVHEYLGRFETMPLEALRRVLLQAIEGRIDLAPQRRAASALCDGLGAERVCDALFASASSRHVTNRSRDYRC